MLNGFLEDKAFQNSNLTTIGDVGYLTPSHSDYFNNESIIHDERSSRLSITYHDQIINIDNFKDYVIKEVYPDILYQHFIEPTDPNDIAIIEILYRDLLSIINDNNFNENDVFQINRNYEMNLYHDKDTLTEQDLWYLSSMSSIEFEAIFNIAERAFLGHYFQESIQEIDNVLKNNHTKFINYKAGSIEIPYLRRLAHIYDPNIDISVLVPPYIKFTLYKSGGYTLDIKIWISRSYFEREYPFTVISQIILPADCQTLANLGSLPNIYQALYESRETTLQQLSPSIGQGKQYSGLIGYDIEYHVPNSNNIFNTTFMILYKGIEPSNLVMKEAIRNYLLNTCTATSVTQWREIYPALFIDNIYYLYPFWDLKFTTPNREIYKSILSINKINAIVNKIHLINNNANVQNIELLNVAYNASFILSCYDVNNTNVSLLSQIFPDYTRISTLNDVYELLDAETKIFIMNINKAIAAGNGETNELSNQIVTLNNYKYIRFFTGYTEFLLQNKNSYNTMIAI